MAIKAIFFDAAGTLIKPARQVGETYSLLARKYGVEVSPAEIAERFRLCFHAAPPLAFPGAALARIEELERAWWQDLVRRIFEPRDGFRRFDDYFAELLLTSPNLMPGASTRRWLRLCRPWKGAAWSLV